MMKVGNLGFREDFRRFFVRGLATLLPTILTIVVLVKCYEFIQQNISVHIIEGIIRVVLVAHDDYPIDKVTPEDINNYKMCGIFISDCGILFIKFMGEWITPLKTVLNVINKINIKML